jgi:hypothetical protein
MTLRVDIGKWSIERELKPILKMIYMPKKIKPLKNWLY